MLQCPKLDSAYITPHTCLLGLLPVLLRAQQCNISARKYRNLQEKITLQAELHASFTCGAYQQRWQHTQNYNQQWVLILRVQLA